MAFMGEDDEKPSLSAPLLEGEGENLDGMHESMRERADSRSLRSSSQLNDASSRLASNYRNRSGSQNGPSDANQLLPGDEETMEEGEGGDFREEANGNPVDGSQDEDPTDPDAYELDKREDIEYEEHDIELACANCRSEFAHKQCFFAFLLIIAGAFLGLTCGAAVICFIRSWSDRHHWWPMNSSTEDGQDISSDELHAKYCPAYYLPYYRRRSSRAHYSLTERWQTLRMTLTFIAIISGALSYACVQLIMHNVRGRLRERRLEANYPWLSKRLGENSAYGEGNSGSGGSRSTSFGGATDRRSRSHSTRRQGRKAFTSNFSRRMSQVHDATLVVGMEFRNLSVSGGGKKLLHNVNGELRPRKLTAIMGPSGAGKSTLLHTLCGRLSPSKGSEIRLNDNQKNSIAQMSKLVGFVPQDDILMASLTVKETLRFHASLRLPARIPNETPSTRERWIDDCIDLLGLTDVKHSIVGDESRRGISGGQRKRVNIGAELVADPSILFCDEPTSGLDSSAALEVINCLKLAAREGMTVVAVIHQPRTSVFELFDDLILLGRTSAKLGGRTVYSGLANGAQKYFEYRGFIFPPQENPADVFIDIVSGSYVFNERVQLHSLTGSRESIALNGALGTAISFDPETQAYCVQLDKGGASVYMQCGNLHPAPQGSQPQLDFSTGTLLDSNSRGWNTPPRPEGKRHIVPNSGGPRINLGDAWQQVMDTCDEATGGERNPRRHSPNNSSNEDPLGRDHVLGDEEVAQEKMGNDGETVIENGHGMMDDTEDLLLGGSNSSVAANSKREAAENAALVEDNEMPRPRGSAVRNKLRGFLFPEEAESENEHTHAAKNVLGSAMHMLEIRLQDHRGRRTIGWFRQLLLFLVRQRKQLMRQNRLILKNIIMFIVAGVLLGALYGDILSDWPSGSSNLEFCPLEGKTMGNDDDFATNWKDSEGGDSKCTEKSIEWARTNGNGCQNYATSVPCLGPSQCQTVAWYGIERDMDLTYRQVFTLALLALALLSVQSSLDLFAEERLVFLRECKHHSVSAYVTGKTISMLPLSLFYPFVYCSVFHTLLNPMAPFADYYWAFLATGVAAESMGVMLSVMFPDTRQVAGGVAVLAMTMFTGCFPLFSESEGSQGFESFSFLRYSAQLIFRSEYLAYTGYKTVPGCAESGTFFDPAYINVDSGRWEHKKAFDKCLQVSPYAGKAFWLLPDFVVKQNWSEAEEKYGIKNYPASNFHEDCPLPWNTNASLVISDDDDSTSQDIWDYQCCGVTLFQKVTTIMKENYDYSMAPDFSYLKLILFALVFRVITVLVLMIQQRRVAV